jgi:hypothetical protein
MTPTDYVFVFYSFILALAVAEVLQGVGQMLYPGSDSRPAGIHTMWVTFLLMLIVLFWWSMWQWRSVETWTAPAFLVQATGVLLLFLVTFVSFPKDVEGVDLGEYYFAVAPKAWWMLAIYFPVSTITARLVLGIPWSPHPADWGNFAALAISVTLARSGRLGLHRIGVSLLLLASVAFLLLRLPSISQG